MANKIDSGYNPTVVKLFSGFKRAIGERWTSPSPMMQN